jgi:hypothetical protein
MMPTSAGAARKSMRGSVALLVVMVGAGGACDVDAPVAARLEEGGTPALARLDVQAVQQGQQIFRYDDFGDWRFWTDALRLHEVVETLTPNQALGLGLKVDAAAIPDAVLQAVLANPELLDDPATTRALLSLNAVVGVTAIVDGDRVTRVGITCALCHSTVDDMTGIGNRVDGAPNGDLAVGEIISLAPGLPAELQPIYAQWPRGFYDARFNFDGISDPAVIPPAYGLHGVDLETYTGEGPLSYWNAYVAVTQMHGHGSFKDDRLGIDIRVPPQEDLVKSKLPALPAVPAHAARAATSTRKLRRRGGGAW